MKRLGLVQCLAERVPFIGSNSGHDEFTLFFGQFRHCVLNWNPVHQPVLQLLLSYLNVHRVGDTRNYRSPRNQHAKYHRGLTPTQLREFVLCCNSSCDDLKMVWCRRQYHSRVRCRQLFLMRNLRNDERCICSSRKLPL